MQQLEGYQAVQKYIGISPQKVRLVMDQVRGMQAQQALDTLQFMTQGAAVPISKAIRSAMANAENNFGADPESLVVSTIRADEGPTRRWRRFGARGRWKPILRRSSHITVILSERGR